MKSVLLRLAGPLQSWGTQGRFGVRDTDREPSKSGVLGLVGAALGMERDDVATLARLRLLRMAVRVDREGGVLRDYHTVGGGTFSGARLGLWSIESGKAVDTNAITYRYYLVDANFLVALEGDDDEFIDRIASALQRPRWPLFLGRRSCPPSMPVFAGVVNRACEPAVREAHVSAAERAHAPERMRIVVESTAAEGRPRQDDPESFALYSRRHALRHVRVEFIETSSIPEAT